MKFGLDPSQNPRSTNFLIYVRMFKLLLILCLGHLLPAVLGTDLSTDVPVGHDAKLSCNGLPTTDTKLYVEWSFDGSRISWFTEDKWCESGHYVNRTRLGSIKENNFSLIINKVTGKDHGLYTCQINDGEKQVIRLNVAEGRKRRDTKTLHGGSDSVCRPYRERKDPPGSVTTDKWDPNQNPTAGPSSEENLPVGPRPGVIVAIVLVVLAVVAAGAAISIRLWRKQQTDENPTYCIPFFYACGKEGRKKRGANLPDPGPSEDALI